ncbi:flavin reductase family protein [Geomicrobium sp. JCM 19039]|uniref:flavin reductase family protein n=1 Tax=Geomicrobium sp. JCM 19039 TaxID=1460636 RepID=UPI00045F1493|nr:flavin reductase family protein [Geomicrobium sp. JCM 19039]GAK12391.1 nitrilotriacetate monooxygenase component B [Geomicrobium sp. JCM 19039]
MDDQLFRTAMSKFATGVTVIVAEQDGKPHGMTANAFMSVSLDPKLILISVDERARMLPIIEASQKFTVNVLRQEQKQMSMRFARQIPSEEPFTFDRFEGEPVIQQSLVSLVCTVHNTYVEGDHTLFIGNVTNLRIEDGNPLAFYEGGYRTVQA